MTSELEVDTGAVRAWAAALSATGALISVGLPPAPPDPRWSATRAALATAEAAGRRLRVLAEDVAVTARQAVGAADDYEDADDRAAVRLRGLR